MGFMEDPIQSWNQGWIYIGCSLTINPENGFSQSVSYDLKYFEIFWI